MCMLQVMFFSERICYLCIYTSYFLTGFPVVHTSPNPDVFIEGDSSASNERMIVAIVALTVTTVFLVPVIVGVICWRRQRKTRILGKLIICDPSSQNQLLLQIVKNLSF